MGLFRRKSLKLGRLFVPSDKLNNPALTKKDFIYAGDTKEAAYDLVRFLSEVAQIKQEEANWDALAKIPQGSDIGPTSEWQFSLEYIGYLLPEWRQKQESLLEELYAEEKPKLTVEHLLEPIEMDMNYFKGTVLIPTFFLDMEDTIHDTLADIGEIEEIYLKLQPITNENRTRVIALIKNIII